MDENVKKIKPLTAQGITMENDTLIYECLELGNSVCCSLTNDNCLKEQSQNASTCLIDSLSIQNENLKLLHDILRKIRANLFEGGN